MNTIKVGDRVRWFVWPSDLIGTVTEITVDTDGDTVYELEFYDEFDHKPVRVDRDEFERV